MYNLRRLYNQNRKKVWKVIIIIVFALLMLRMLNQIAKEYNESKKEDEQNTIIDVQSNYKEDYTAISNKQINESVAQENSEIIKEFINLCNERNIEGAYNLLSNECKEVNYPTIEVFKTNYYDKIFTTTKSFNQEGWITKDNRYTYRITIINDPLSTGTVNYNNSFQDFYTIVENDGELKLNISSYIAREEINKGVEINNVKINVKYRDCYMNYEEYVLEIANYSDKVVALDSKEKSDTLYILGELNNKYSCYNSEITTSYSSNVLANSEEISSETEEIIREDNTITTNVVIPSKTIKNVKIKFNKMYSPERKITAMEFSDFIEDYEEYLNTNNKKMYNARQVIRIDL